MDTVGAVVVGAIVVGAIVVGAVVVATVVAATDEGGGVVVDAALLVVEDG